MSGSRNLGDLLKSRLEAFRPSDVNSIAPAADPRPLTCAECGSPLSEMSQFCWMCGATAPDVTVVSSVDAMRPPSEPTGLGDAQAERPRATSAGVFDASYRTAESLPPTAEPSPYAGLHSDPLGTEYGNVPYPPPHAETDEPDIFSGIYGRDSAERDEQSHGRFDYRLIVIPALMLLIVGLLYVQRKNAAVLYQMTAERLGGELSQIWPNDDPVVPKREGSVSRLQSKARNVALRTGREGSVEVGSAKSNESLNVLPQSMRIRVIGQPAPIALATSSGREIASPNEDAVAVDLADAAVRSSSRQPPFAVRVTPLESLAMLLKQVPPVYPAVARAARVQGEVVLQATIAKDGNVGDLKVVSGDPLLTGAAVDAVRQWVYKPYYRNGQPTEVQTMIVVEFSLATQHTAQKSEPAP